MNKTKIEYVDYTWNPVTGCQHNCWYCYAAKIANRFGASHNKSDSKIHELALYGGTMIDLKTKVEDPFDINRLCVGLDNPYPFKFEPTLHYYRLYEPKERKKGSKIFVCSMADLFGDWVPAGWIYEVLATVRETPWHTYLFLTKNPKRYAEFLFPENCWLGATLTGGAEDIPREDDTTEFLRNREISNLKFISFEPLLGMPYYALFKLISITDWIIVGGLTPKSAHDDKTVKEFIERARLYNKPIFLKDNLKWHEEIKEFPEWNN